MKKTLQGSKFEFKRRRCEKGCFKRNEQAVVVKVVVTFMTFILTGK